MKRRTFQKHQAVLFLSDSSEDKAYAHFQEVIKISQTIIIIIAYL